MNTEINRISWKCRRGMREIDLLLREFSNTILSSLDECSINTFDQVLDYDDQKLFDYIFKNEITPKSSHIPSHSEHILPFALLLQVLFLLPLLPFLLLPSDSRNRAPSFLYVNPVR